MLPDSPAANDIPIACVPDAIPADQRDRWTEVGKKMYASVQEVKDLPDGYAFRFPLDTAMLLLVADDVSMERLCCPFLHFKIEIAPAATVFWLHMTGGEGAKELLRLGFEGSDLLAVEVAEAAGFSTANRPTINTLSDVYQAVETLNTNYAKSTTSRQS